MKIRTVMLLFMVTVCLLFIVEGCIVDPNPEEIPIKDPGPPPDPPPDPPPPPCASHLSGSAETMPELTAAVLAGEYGSELQKLLATEISVCLNQMLAEGMISVYMADGIPGIESDKVDKAEIIYSHDYLVRQLMDGEFGAVARLNLHAFIRSFDDDGESGRGK